ncbi:Tim44 domain-containing protein [Herbaspirillum sp. LeCh32-8]|uniref:Tim44 domain-containing protein n=1 Tax=Herbaspirillum sp. LeCh32-8 TaxID=2821356 RepID=UPI001AE4053C|nr:Tim44-like domain-containing protein [Herbaspirillum sp. LeCh32-8]MBP0600294.1 Tim44 domain-containing protein [Herbaspirillum sp. LeCh32-8]
MKKAFVALIVAVMTLSVGISTVEAKRLGGGGSIGKQSAGAGRQAQSPAAPMQQNAAAAKPAAPAAAPAAAKPSPWKGILGGALLGLGLGALLSHLGLGGALASMISTILTVALIAMAAMFIYRMFRRKSEASQPRPAWAGANDNHAADSNATPKIGSLLEPAQPPAAPQGGFGGGGFGNAEAVAYGVPAGFDTVGFVRNAKTYFIRLQAAWDKADINDIREFTTPEMFAELRLQIQERGAAANHTDVVSLDAEVLGVETVGNDHVASVKFFGFIKEDQNASPAQFAEIWNLSKPTAGQGGWVLAGIQQVDPVSA